MKTPTTKLPEHGGSYAHDLQLPGGGTLKVYETEKRGFATVEIPDRGKDVLLQVVRETAYTPAPATYVAFRDGKCNADKLAFVVQGDDVYLQYILDGVGPEGDRVRILSLGQLEQAVADATRPAPQ